MPRKGRYIYSNVQQKGQQHVQTSSSFNGLSASCPNAVYEAVACLCAKRKCRVFLCFQRRVFRVFRLEFWNPYVLLALAIKYFFTEIFFGKDFSELLGSNFGTPIFFPCFTIKKSASKKIFKFKKNHEVFLINFKKIMPFQNAFP